MSVSQLPPNPDYGTGIFRRGVRLTNRPGQTFGELEDTAHAMRCMIRHDEEKITAVEVDFVRLPMNTCTGAGGPLQELVGMALDTPFSWFYGDGRPRRNCTHLYDLLWWTIAHAGRDAEERLYEIVVPDHPGDAAGSATLFRNGRVVLEWLVKDGVIHAPAQFAGREIMRGFTSWALDNLDGDMLEAALVLQKGCFISDVRRIDVKRMVGPLAVRESALKGVCWTFSSPRFERAVRVDSTRDLADRTKLLRFLDGNIESLR